MFQIKKGIANIWEYKFCVFLKNPTVTKMAFLCHCRCHHEWLQHPFMSAVAMKKMGIMATGCGVHIVMAMAMEKLSFSVLSVAVAAAV